MLLLEITSCECICIVLGTLLLFWIVLLERHLHTVLEKPQIVSYMAQDTIKKQKKDINKQIIYSKSSQKFSLYLFKPGIWIFHSTVLAGLSNLFIGRFGHLPILAVLMFSYSMFLQSVTFREQNTFVRWKIW